MSSVESNASSSSHREDVVDFLGRSSSTLSLTPIPKSTIHSPTPRRAHSALFYPISAVPFHLVQDHQIIDRGYNTAPSPQSSTHVSQRKKKRRAAPVHQHSSSDKSTPTTPLGPRVFLVPKDSARRIKKSNDFHEISTVRKISIPPVDSTDSVLDNFVVESAAALASATRPCVCSEDPTKDRWHKLCNSFLHTFKDLERYRQFLEYRDEHAQNLLDSIQDLLDCNHDGQQLKFMFVVALSRLARESELYPRRFILHDVNRRQGTLAEGRIEKGDFTGQAVCIKVPKPRTHASSDLRSFRRALSREIVPWAQLRHENVLPFCGIIRLSDNCEWLGIVTPFLENGNIVEFLKRNPNTDRPSLIFGVAAGMCHLHDNGIIHGDIKGSNILVTSTIPPRACLADFGVTAPVESDPRSSTFSSGPVGGGTLQSSAPELLSPEKIFTGNVPFPNNRDLHVMAVVTQGRRPARPVGSIYKDRGLTDDMWELLDDSWSENPGARPSAHQIVERLRKKSILVHQSIGQSWGKLSPPGFGNIASRPTPGGLPTSALDSITLLKLDSILADVAAYRMLLKSTDTEAQTVLDVLQSVLDTSGIPYRGRLIVAMQRLAAKTKLYPQRYVLGGLVKFIGDHSVDSGRYADIYKADFQGQRTCLKVVRVHETSLVQHMTKTYAREAILWGQLSHPNVLPFYGLYEYQSRVAFVAPWAENGNLSIYLKRNPSANRILLVSTLVLEIPIVQLIIQFQCADTAAGVEYLHANGIVHGDLKALNVLVDMSGRACLSDFGLSGVADKKIMTWATQSSAASKGGTSRWQAPELHDPDINNIHNSKESDVFAWASTNYEIFTGNVPFHDVHNELKVAFKIRRGEFPTRPPVGDKSWAEQGLTERIWDMLTDCWKTTPSDRPDISTVVSRLAGENPAEDLRQAGQWASGLAMQFRNAHEASIQESRPSMADLDVILSRVLEESAKAGDGNGDKK
ncbi:hypothetical protein DXG01_008409 [Tephrocybe rancida]|nr:hypothetical protein DXG01_008409 [Tephrocybe rancida]